MYLQKKKTLNNNHNSKIQILLKSILNYCLHKRSIKQWWLDQKFWFRIVPRRLHKQLMRTQRRWKKKLDWIKQFEWNNSRLWICQIIEHVSAYSRGLSSFFLFIFWVDAMIAQMYVIICFSLQSHFCIRII